MREVKDFIKDKKIDLKRLEKFGFKLKETGVQIGMLFDALFTLSPVMYFNNI